MLNFIAIDLQLYKILQIMRVSFFGTQCNVIKYIPYDYNIVYKTRTNNIKDVQPR